MKIKVPLGDMGHRQRRCRRGNGAEQARDDFIDMGAADQEQVQNKQQKNCDSGFYHSDYQRFRARFVASFRLKIWMMRWAVMLACNGGRT